MRPTLLIVEDNPAVRRALRAWLASALPEYELAEAESGEEALERVAERAPSLVLMDINLPGMNGIEATRRLRETAPATPVVIVTLHDTEPYRREAAAAGAAAFIAKDRMGFDLLPLLRRLLPLAPAPG